MDLGPWGGIGTVLAILVALLGVLRLVQVRCAVSPEAVRKGLHVSMGLVCLAFPRLFAQAWPPVLLAGASMSLFAALRFYPPLRRGLGAVVHSVTRRSLGEFYFPAGVLAAFLMSSDDFPVYAISILTLALADPAAAFIGMRCGRPRKRGRGRAKTVQGSLAFLLVTFVLALPWLHLRADADALRSLLVALDLAILLMIVEASARNGADNLLVPASAALSLQWLLSCSVPVLSLVLACAIVAALALAAVRTERPRARALTRSTVPDAPPGANPVTSPAP